MTGKQAPAISSVIRSAGTGEATPPSADVPLFRVLLRLFQRFDQRFEEPRRFTAGHRAMIEGQ